VFAAGSEDMDTLTFNTPVLYRHLTFSEAKKAPISEIILEKALEGLGMNMEQFTELCILLGCDYLEPIKGVGPKNAFKLMQEHGSLKEVMKVLYAKMAEREEADLKKEKKAKKAAKKETKSKSKKDEDEDEAMESEEDEKPAPKTTKAKSKKRIESDDEEADGGAESEDWDDTVVATSPARGSSPVRASSPAASSDAGMKLDEEEEKKQDEEVVEDHKMEDATEAEKEKERDTEGKEGNNAEVKEENDAEAKAGGSAADEKAEKEKKAKDDEEAPKKPAPVRRGGIHVPEYYPWEEAKKLFLKPDVTPADQVEIVWESPDVDGLVQFLVVEKGFNEDRVRKGAEKLIKMLNTKQQGRLDGFFKVTESASSKAKAGAGGKSGAGSKGAGAKRKADDKKDTGGKKAKTGGRK
ncbi:Elongation of fatty acids protein 2, partial [Ceratobasidium sp. 395]